MTDQITKQVLDIENLLSELQGANAFKSAKLAEEINIAVINLKKKRIPDVPIVEVHIEKTIEEA